MSDTPRTDYAIKLWVVENPNVSLEKDHVGILCRKLERELNQAIKERDENKAGWDRASLTALDLEQRLKRAEKCISAIEAQYKSSCGEYYDITTLNTIITNWRDSAKTPQS